MDDGRVRGVAYFLKILLAHKTAVAFHKCALMNGFTH